MDKDALNLRSGSFAGFSTKVRTGSDEYLVITEDTGSAAKPNITTRIFQGGRLMKTRETAYQERAASAGPERLRELMLKQHEVAINILKAEKSDSENTIADYIKKLNCLIRSKDHREALTVAAGAMEIYPENPFLLSYMGYLEAAVNRQERQGLQTCLRAMDLLVEKLPHAADFFYSVLYLNLGRVYLVCGEREKAVQAFKTGLEKDVGSELLIQELESMGIRKTPPIPFLNRSNPVNRLLGKMRKKN